MDKKISAILCDLDGVLTNTARIHAQAWKTLFDEFFVSQKLPKEFSIDTDYPKYVDGKPRIEGIRSFLKALDISIPEGKKTDSHDALTIQGLAKKKNFLFNEVLSKEGAEVFLESVNAVKAWKEKGLKTAVVSSSKNCRPVLDSAGITDLFDVIVDGLDAEENHLKGKPEPDTFLYAATELDVDPSESAVAEDSVAGIEAAVKGGIGLVIGVEKDGNSSSLKQKKADIVVKSLSQIRL